MSTTAIPKKLIKEKDLVLIPRKEYEALLELKKIREFNPTAAQKKALQKSEDNLRKNRAISYHELAKKLGFKS